MKRVTIFGICCLLFLSVAACSSSQEVAGGLSGRQSVEIVVALTRSGVPATREQSAAGREGSYRVLVSPADYGRALEVLHEHGLPRASEDSLEEMTRPRGFVPNSPQLAQLRLDHALELRVERALLSLPGVIEARVIVQSERSAAGFASQPSTRGVSVVVRLLRPEDGAEATEDEIRTLVAQAVPGVSPSDVQVRSVRASISIDPVVGANLVQLKPFSFRVPSAERSAAGLQILVMFAAFCLAGLLLGIAWTNKMQANRRRRMRSVLSGEGGRSVFLEASLQENPRTKVSLPQIREQGDQ